MTDLGNEQKTRFSTQVSPAVQARVRATVRGVVAATGTDYSLAQLVEDALMAYCARLEEQYHFGSPWPLSDRPLRPGPRVGG
jgi:hypothetical protein